MSPASIGLLPRGQAKWYSQRVRPRPFTDCMFASVCTPLSFMGYDLPAMFVVDLRDASGVPNSRPTSTAATKKALNKLIPDAPIWFGGLADEVLLRRLARGEIAARVMVRNPRLPERLRRFVGRNWPGVHAVALGGARRRADGGFDVLWMDPMGLPRDTYNGEFVAYEGVKGALLRTDSGMVRVTYGERDAALADPPDQSATAGGTPSTVPSVGPGSALVLTRARLDEFVAVPQGTPFLHPRTLDPVTKAGQTADFRLAGRSLDGRFFGAWVNTRKLRGAKGLTLLLVERQRVGRPFIRTQT